MAMLSNTRHELFARNIANGLARSRAYVLAGYTENKANANKLWRHKGNASERIQQRVRELLDSKAKAIDLTANDILDMTYATYQLANESGQHSAALKATEMLGKQMHSMFTERRETVNINIASMSWQQVEKYITERYGDKSQDLLTWIKEHYWKESNDIHGPDSRARDRSEATHKAQEAPKLLEAATIAPDTNGRQRAT